MQATIKKFPSFLDEDIERTQKYAAFTESTMTPGAAATDAPVAGAKPFGILKSEYHLRCMEQLLATMDRVNEQKLAESPTTTGSVATFSRISKGMITRVYPNLIADQLISIQPTPLPDYRVFFLDFTFGTSIAPTASGDRMDYAALKQNANYASGVIVGETVGTGDGSTVIFTTAFHPIKTGSVTATSAGVSAPITSVNYTTGAVTLTSAPAGAATVKISYSLILEGLGLTGNATIPEINFAITSASVTVTEKKIMAQWTLETEQDLETYHGLSAQKILAEKMAWEIQFEIDRGIINDLLTGASAGNVNWSKAIPSGVLAKDWYETLFHAIEDAALLIYQLRLVFPNWIVTGPDVSNKLMKTLSFRPTVSGTDVGTLNAGPNVFGALGERYKVIVDPLFPANTVLVGYKGPTMMDTGYIYSPYTLFQSAVFTDPATMVPRMGLASRQANYLVSGQFYATVTVTA